MDDGTIDLWGTHLPVLLEAILHTTGPVLELGSGHYSTRLIRVCAGAFPARRFVTCDNQRDWWERVKDLASANHEIVCEPWTERFVAEALARRQPWDVVFVDEAPAQHRCPEIKRLRNVTELFVVNNVEPDPRGDAPYRPVYRGYADLLPTFRFSHVYKRYPVWTGIYSDSPLPEWVGKSL